MEPAAHLTALSLQSNSLAHGIAERLLKDVPSGAFAPAFEVADAICFFASGTATHATGQTLDINGASYVR